MIYNGVPINSMKVKHYELNTNDCDMIASDLQAGKTAVARGKKITGTGKSFEFACYGSYLLNTPIPVPADVNTLQFASIEYPVMMNTELVDVKNLDLSVTQNIASVIIENTEYPVSVVVSNNLLTISCEKTILLQVFYGKDNYT